MNSNCQLLRNMCLASPAALLLALFVVGVSAQESVTTDAGTLYAENTKRFFKEDTYSPYAGRNFPGANKSGILRQNCALWTQAATSCAGRASSSAAGILASCSMKM